MKNMVRLAWLWSVAPRLKKYKSFEKARNFAHKFYLCYCLSFHFCHTIFIALFWYLLCYSVFAKLILFLVDVVWCFQFPNYLCPEMNKLLPILANHKSACCQSPLFSFLRLDCCMKNFPQQIAVPNCQNCLAKKFQYFPIYFQIRGFVEKRVQLSF